MITNDFIDISEFEICKIDNKSLKEICLLSYGNNKNKYKLQLFFDYIKSQYHLTPQEYCEKFLSIDWRKSLKTKKYTGYRISGKGIKISKFGRGEVNTKNCEAFRMSCEKEKITRLGEGNPMFGKPAWNKGLNKFNNGIMFDMSLKAIGKKFSESHIKHLKESRNNSKFQARHTQSHSKETKEKFKKIIAKRYRDGIFNRKTSISIKVEKFLFEISNQLLEIPISEYTLEMYSLDFGFPASKIDLEVNGKYFHVDKRFYPNGPINEMQRKNAGRDKAKKTFLAKNGWKIIEIWETEINNGNFKKELLCKLKESNLLKI